MHENKVKTLNKLNGKNAQINDKLE